MSRKKTLLSKEAKAAIANAKAARKNANELYKKHIKEMRPYLKKLKNIDLRKPLSSGQKSFITKAYVEYTELTTRPFKIYKSKSKSRLKKAQMIGRHDVGPVKFDVAFVPSADPHAKLIFKGDEVFLKTKHVVERYLFFNKRSLTDNPEKEIARQLARAPEAKQFVVMAGKYLWNGGLARSHVEEKVLNLMDAYNNPDANNFYGNWLHGLVSAQYTDQKLVDEYRREYHRQKELIKSAKAKQRRKNVRQHGKKH
jgi:hypothetical protein